jgi:4-amino-4-deoxychorismate lyase
MSSSPAQSWLWLHDHFVPQSQLPLSDRGFRYGMSLFESFRLRDGQLYFAREHWLSLQDACSQCGFPLSDAVFPSLAPLLSTLHGDWFVRLYVTAGDGAPSAPVTASRVFVFAEPRVHEPLLEHWVTITEMPCQPVLGGLKTANYWPNILALTQAHDLNATETLLFNTNAHLVSASMANVFLRIDGQWVTPSPRASARKGVIRSWVLDHLNTEERLLSIEEVRRADSGFLSNSWMGISQMAVLEGKTLQKDDGILELKALLERVHQIP